MNELEKIQQLELKRKEQNKKIRNAKKRAREKVQLQIADYLFEVAGWTGRNKDKYIEELDLESFKNFCNRNKDKFAMALKGKRPTQNSQNQGSNLPNNAGLEQKRVNTQPQTTTAQNTPYN